MHWLWLPLIAAIFNAPTDYAMKSTFLSSIATGLFTMGLVLLITGCEPDLQFSAENITAQAKNAVDILPAHPTFVGMMNTQDLKSNSHTDVFGTGGLLQEEMPQEALSHLRDFVEMTGFNPEEDLNEVYIVAEQVANSAHQTVSIVAYASIEPASLQAYVENRMGDELQRRTYRGIEVYEGKKSDHAPSFSFINAEMMIAASTTDALEAMIDRLEGEGMALNSNKTMMDLIARASTGKSGWFVAKKPDDRPFSNTGAGNDLAQNAIQIWGELEYVVGAVSYTYRR
jgi:hypothetical protein